MRVFVFLQDVGVSHAPPEQGVPARSQYGDDDSQRGHCVGSESAPLRRAGDRRSGCASRCRSTGQKNHLLLELMYISNFLIDEKSFDN